MRWISGLFAATSMALVLAGPVGFVHAGGCRDGSRATVYYYDGKGRIDGRSVTHGDKTVYYDSRGRISGKSVTRKGETVYYDRRGRIIGRALAR
ncbi:hypothetical protein DAMNIGENAA_28640 [Desulforhabdus amnigena]|uniref:Uncharacterized protein n=2 Tax=Desulforhabdus amnigena TaxID=40218 RepID=A0A9W6L9X4_9BACT|nr:hypothetical protein DAMNIGENAA_28640 [Desulforhabdus amnigena]